MILLGQRRRGIACADDKQDDERYVVLGQHCKELLAPLDNRIDMVGPIVEHGRLDICAVGPLQRAKTAIQYNLPEEPSVTQGAEERPDQDWLQIDSAFQTILRCE